MYVCRSAIDDILSWVIFISVAFSFRSLQRVAYGVSRWLMLLFFFLVCMIMPMLTRDMQEVYVFPKHGTERIRVVREVRWGWYEVMMNLWNWQTWGVREQREGWFVRCCVRVWELGILCCGGFDGPRDVGEWWDSREGWLRWEGQIQGKDKLEVRLFRKGCLCCRLDVEVDVEG